MFYSYLKRTEVIEELRSVASHDVNAIESLEELEGKSGAMGLFLDDTDLCIEAKKLNEKLPYLKIIYIGEGPVSLNGVEFLKFPIESAELNEIFFTLSSSEGFCTDDEKVLTAISRISNTMMKVFEKDGEEIDEVDMSDDEGGNDGELEFNIPENDELDLGENSSSRLSLGEIDLGEGKDESSVSTPDELSFEESSSANLDLGESDKASEEGLSFENTDLGLVDDLSFDDEGDDLDLSSNDKGDLDFDLAEDSEVDLSSSEEDDLDLSSNDKGDLDFDLSEESEVDLSSSEEDDLDLSSDDKGDLDFDLGDDSEDASGEGNFPLSSSDFTKEIDMGEYTQSSDLDEDFDDVSLMDDEDLGNNTGAKLINVGPDLDANDIDETLNTMLFSPGSIEENEDLDSPLESIIDEERSRSDINVLEETSEVKDLSPLQDNSIIEEVSIPIEQSVASLSRAHSGPHSSESVIRYNEDELLRLKGTIRQLRDERENFLKKIEKFEKSAELKEQDFIGIQSELDELKIEISILKKRHLSEVEELKYQKQLSDEKKEIYAQRAKNIQKELDRMNSKMRIDLGHVRQREKELEGQLELVTMDTDSKVKSRDLKILELKRKIDSLEFNMENAVIREQKLKEDKVKIEDRMDKIMRTLRGSIQLLEDEAEFSVIDVEKEKLD